MRNPPEENTTNVETEACGDFKDTSKASKKTDIPKNSNARPFIKMIPTR